MIDSSPTHRTTETNYEDRNAHELFREWQKVNSSRALGNSERKVLGANIVEVIKLMK